MTLILSGEFAWPSRSYPQTQHTPLHDHMHSQAIEQITNMDLIQDLDAYVSVYHEMYIKARNESEGLPMYFKRKEKEISNEVKEEHNWLNKNYIEALVEYKLWVHICESHCLEIRGSC
jgi:hypothetical protein